MTRLWQALERIDDVATSYASWRLMLGDEYDQYCDLLTPMNQFAKSLPVPGRPYQSIEIIEVDDGVFEGYDEKTESYLSVDRRDIVCYEFRFDRLADELSELVGFDVSFEQLTGPRYRYRLGHYGNPDGHGFAFYFAKVCDPRRLDGCVDAF